jgi:hypothetical protein
MKMNEGNALEKPSADVLTVRGGTELECEAGFVKESEERDRL